MNKNQGSDPHNPESTETWRPFWIALAGGFCLVASFYPFEITLLAWLAPLGYLFLVSPPNLPARKPKTQIWLACFVNMLILFQCVRLPHWAGYIGWPLLASYLCCYPFFFIVLTRHVIHRWHVPLLIAAPIVWGGLEFLQARLFTGISLGMLSHSQVTIPIVIQVADIAGCYTISFLMVLVVTGLFQFGSGVFGRASNRRDGLIGLCIAITGLSFMLIYGQMRLKNSDLATEQSDFRVALIQGAIDTQFPADDKSMEAYLNRIRDEYTDLSVSSRSDPNVQLIIWPESMFLALDAYTESDSLSADQKNQIQKLQESLAYASSFACGAVMADKTGKWFRARKPIAMLLGANSGRIEEPGFYNSAIQIDVNGKVTERYAKMNLVLFGEYVPLGEQFPWLYNFFPMGAGMKSGETPKAMKFGSYVLVPNICFESTYPHLIRRHVSQLTAEGNRPNCLVNLSNDGWFWGSNALDMHFANNILRSVENRIPSLIAANTGFSGQIDGAGRVLHKGRRRAKEVIFVDLITSTERSLYETIGDLPWILCLILVFVTFCDSIRAPFRSQKLQLRD